VDLADRERASERGSRTFQISSPLNRDRIDIGVDLGEVNMRNSALWRSRCRLEWGEVALASDRVASAFEGVGTSCGFGSSERAAAHGH